MTQLPRQRTRSFASLVTAKRPQAEGFASPVLGSGHRIAVVHRDPHDLKASARQLRAPLKRRKEHLVQSLRRFGCVQVVLISKNGEIVAGHGIVEAALSAGLATVPTVTLDHLSEGDQRALRLALEKIAGMSTWNEEVLRAEFEALSQISLDLPSFTGFSSAEIDALLNGPGKSDDAVPPIAQSAVSRFGDIWCFEGGHRLGCLNALESVSYEALMAGELASLAMCDPPFNVHVAGHITGRADAREFAMASGEMSKPEFITFLRVYLAHLRASCRDGALLLQWMDWRHMGEMLSAGEAVELELINLIVWSKTTNPGMGSLWRSAHELLFAWKSGSAPHINNVELGRNGRNRSNVWEYPGANAFSSREDREGLVHVTPKNIAMIQDAILDVSRPGDIVLDCFLGSGTTLLAAHRAKRRGYGLELDPLYVDLAVKRMEARTKAPARHAETGLTFEETAQERATVHSAAPRARTRAR